ncbi:MAG: Na+/H+ antiporter NhaA [Azospirillaceae bacterium]|nr:Na+/H+ antiporter NhaA [Azospirillaceae bacterium]
MAWSCPFARRVRAGIARFSRLQTAPALVLILATLVALVWVNSPLRFVYEALTETPVSVGAGIIIDGRTVIDDVLMVLFFVVAGLEIKREVLTGTLADRRGAALPVLAALGGMVVPALVYLATCGTHPDLIAGWAIPAATDIAFAVGVLTLVAPGLPPGLRSFLLALAIIDDLGAIVIIAVAYSGPIALLPLALAVGLLVAALICNKAGVRRLPVYLAIGAGMWLCVVMSGVHATVAGVALALVVPSGGPAAPAGRLEHALLPWVAFGVLPVFALANAGIPLHGLSVAALVAPLPLAIALGLGLGKPVGVLAASTLAIRLGVGRRPDGVSPLQFFGVALLTGIGFTMSLFIGDLAFDGSARAHAVRLGVISGSLMSALLGSLVLLWGSIRRTPVVRG